MEREKKGQAAMEFLMTYGWAILAAIIAIGVLAYFGVFSPERLASSTGVLNAPFNMDTFAIVNDGGAVGSGCNTFDCIRMEVTQNSGQAITSFNITVIPRRGINTNPAPTWFCNLVPAIANGWSTGSKELIECNTGIQGSWTATDAVSADITLRYTTTGSNINQTASGSVRGTSQ